MVNNPYTEMLIASRPDRVFGRDRDLGYILRNITQRMPSSIAIAGPRTMGKTTLLHQIKAVAESPELLRAQREWVGDDFRPGDEDGEDATPRRALVAVYVDLEGIENPQPQDVFGLLLRQLRAQALTSGHFRAGGDLPVAERNDTGEQSFDKLREALIRLAPVDEDAQHAVRIVFLLDNFDGVLDEKVKTPLDSQLRVLRTYAAFVVAFENPPTAADSFLLGITYDVTLGALDPQAARVLILQSEEFGEPEEAFLVRVAGRQPFLLVTACAALLELYQIDAASKSNLRDGGESAHAFEAQFVRYLLLQRTVDQALRRLWGRLSDQERQVALLLANNKALDAGARLTILRLVDKGAVRTEGGTPVLFSALFAEYVLRQAEAMAAPPAATPPVYQDIGRSLGPKDQAVLRYILDRPNRLISFSDLLDTFWGPGDNTAKERKRRLDVAIHRIRTAMDAGGLDGPAHLRNLRGKGFEFIP